MMEQTALDRMLGLLRWYFSGFYNKPKGLKKPLNPLLGEIHRVMFEHPSKDGRPPTRTFYVAEQVCHHPPTTALAVLNRQAGWVMDGSILCRSKFWGNSAASLHETDLRLHFLQQGEMYRLTMPDYHVKGLLIGKMITEFGGRTTIFCEKTDLRVEIRFKLKPRLKGTYNQVEGTIHLGDKQLFKLHGRWDRAIYLTPAMGGADITLLEINEELLCRRLKRKVVPSAQQTPFTEEHQGTFDSLVTWEAVSVAIRTHDQPNAVRAKRYLEDCQRRKAKLLEETKEPFVHRHFSEQDAKWHYNHLDLRPWDAATDGYVYERDGIVATLRLDEVPAAPQAKAPLVLKPIVGPPRKAKAPKPTEEANLVAADAKQKRVATPSEGAASTKSVPAVHTGTDDSRFESLEEKIMVVQSAVETTARQHFRLLMVVVLAVLIHLAVFLMTHHFSS